MRKHDKVRQQKEELEKIVRIERELSGSIELRQVSKVQDTEEFENHTNREFNKNYETAFSKVASPINNMMIDIRKRRCRGESIAL
mmetsp:Transcript_5574/g.8790  ORF Transcript_5574/g.8790 Transcript_5574/m.8790 type:complete len:85 (+) Transcript_5574:35-289(+)